MKDRLRIVVLVAIATVMGGCTLFPPPFDGGATYPSFDPGEYPELSFGPDEEFGRPIGAYDTGTATLTIGGESVVLDILASDATLTRITGLQIYLRNEQGWGLRLSGPFEAYEAPDSGLAPQPYLTIERIQTTYWSTGSEDCTVTTSVLTAERVAGTATCSAVRWRDMLQGWTSQDGPPVVEGEAPFDATLTFELTGHPVN